MRAKPRQARVYILSPSALCQIIDKAYLDGMDSRNELPEPLERLVNDALGVGCEEAFHGWYFGNIDGCETAEEHAQLINCFRTGVAFLCTGGSIMTIHLVVQRLQADGHLPAGDYVLTRE